MDAVENEVDGVDISGFPTLIMFKKETNEQIDYIGWFSSVFFLPFLYTMIFLGGRNLEELTKFIETGEQEEADEPEEPEEDDEDLDDMLDDDEDEEEEDEEDAVPPKEEL